MTTSIPAHTGTEFKALYRAEYMNVTTFRKNGAPVPTPVWFAEKDGILYVESAADAGKIKRIRRNPRVVFAPCSASGKITGETFRGEARVLTDIAEIYVAKGALHRKYHLKRQLFYSVMELIRLIKQQPEEKVAFFAIHPAVD